MHFAKSIPLASILNDFKGWQLLTLMFNNPQLPSSFLAAVFAINLDAFPLNSEGKLPLSYFLKFLCMRIVPFP